MNETMITADRLLPGQSGRITQLSQHRALRQRLLELGLIPGAVILRRHTAPAGSPIAFESNGMLLALRRQDAQRILVQEVEGHWIP